MENYRLFQAIVEKNLRESSWPKSVQDSFEVAEITHKIFKKAATDKGMNLNVGDMIDAFAKMNSKYTLGETRSLVLLDFLEAATKMPLDGKLVAHRLHILQMMFITEFFLELNRQNIEISLGVYNKDGVKVDPNELFGLKAKKTEVSGPAEDNPAVDQDFKKAIYEKLGIGGKKKDKKKEKKEDDESDFTSGGFDLRS